MAPVGHKNTELFYTGREKKISIEQEQNKWKIADSVPLNFQAFLQLFSKMAVATKRSRVSSYKLGCAH